LISGDWHRSISFDSTRSKVRVLPYGIVPIFAYEYGILESSNGLIAGLVIKIVEAAVNIKIEADIKWLRLIVIIFII
jgi:hypothetical protein